MLPKFFASKWFERLFTVALAVLVVAITQSWISRREYNDRLKKDFEARPTTEQVASIINELRAYVDKQDDNTLSKLDQHIVESAKTDQVSMKLWESIDGKLNFLLNRSRNE